MRLRKHVKSAVLPLLNNSQKYAQNYIKTVSHTFFIKYIFYSYSDEATQMKRLMERNNLTQSDAELRINAQMSLDEKCKRASYIIDNSSNCETTEKQVKRLHETFTQSFAYLPLRVFVIFVLISVAWLLIFLMRLVSW